MAYYIYVEKTNSNREDSELETSVTINQDISNSNESVVTEKQNLNGVGYTITLYSNNEVKITPIIEEIQTILGNAGNLNETEKSCDVIGFSGNIEKMYQGNNGTSVDPITFFIMEDGTVEYIQPLSQIINNNDTIPSEFKIDGKIDDLNDVADLKTNSNGVIIAITKDGKEIECWNEIFLELFDD